MPSQTSEYLDRLLPVFSDCDMDFLGLQDTVVFGCKALRYSC